MNFYKAIAFAGLTFLMSFSAGCGDKNPASAPAVVPTELEGVWNGYSDADTNNPGLPKAVLTYSFTNNKIAVTSDSCTQQGFSACVVQVYQGTFVLDTTADPKKIDIQITQSSRAGYLGKTILALYDKSANILTISANGFSSPRPSAIDGRMSIHLVQ